MLIQRAFQTKEKRTYTIAPVPGGETSPSRVYSARAPGLLLALAGIVLLVAASTVAVLVLTPAGRLLAVAHPEVEHRYTARLAAIQSKIDTLAHELLTLQSYNMRLRQALGERVPSHRGTPPLRDLAVNGSAWRQDAPAASGRAPGARKEGLLMRDAPAGAPQESGVVDFPLVAPALGYLSRGVEPGEGHFGIDIAGREGSPVVAAADGRVVFADWSYDFGYTMILAHAHGYATVYKHNQSLLRDVAGTVRRGELIAFLGNTGRTSSGPHVHFELWKDGTAQDPTNYLITLQ